jgi:hypothetical protein
MSGYDGWLSIEHEDVMLSRAKGLRKSVELLRNVMPAEPGDYKPQEFKKQHCRGEIHGHVSQSSACRRHSPHEVERREDLDAVRHNAG